MKPRHLSRLLLAVTLPVSAWALDVSVSAEIRLGRALPPAPPEVEIIEPVGPKGPPPWAPAHGFRRNRDYYYYPEARVYYRPADRVWFYLEGSTWRIGAELPAAVRIDFGRSVKLTMETDRPFDQDRHVATYYPRDYFSKVKIKPKAQAPGREKKPERKPRPAAPADESSTSRGKGQGKGQGRDR